MANDANLFDTLLAAHRPDADTFAQSVMDALYQRGVAGEIVYDPKAYLLKLPDGGQVRLGEAFQACRKAAPEAQDALAGRVAAATVPPGIPNDFNAAKGHLRPQVRTQEDLDLARLSLQAAGYPSLDPAQKAWMGGHVLTLAWDMDECSMQIQPAHLERWKVSLETALEAAQANLRQHTAPEFTALRPGIYQSAWEDDYDAARLGISALFNHLEIQAPVLAMTPARNILLAWSEADTEGLAWVADYAEGILNEEPHALSPEVFKLSGQTWAPWFPDPQKPEHQPLRVLGQRWNLHVYDRQRSALLATLKGRDDVFVATLKLSEREDGSNASYTVLTEGVPTYLPKADLLVLVPDEGGPLHVHWSEGVRLLGEGALKPQGRYPERYFTDRFPTPDQIEHLRSRK